jgi:hypothetical protein
VPVIAPAGTAPGRLVTETGAGIAFEGHDADSILRAFDQARERYPSLALAAHQASTRWLEAEGVDRFAAALEDPDPARKAA